MWNLEQPWTSPTPRSHGQTNSSNEVHIISCLCKLVDGAANNAMDTRPYNLIRPNCLPHHIHLLHHRSSCSSSSQSTILAVPYFPVQPWFYHTSNPFTPRKPCSSLIPNGGRGFRVKRPVVLQNSGKTRKKSHPSDGDSECNCGFQIQPATSYKS